MKTVIIIIVTGSLSYFIYSGLRNKKPTIMPVVQANSMYVHDLTIVIFQDVSQSIKKNGVELLSSETLMPYFRDTSRNIDLYFGVIAGSSARKLLHTYLPEPTFKHPGVLSLNSSSVTERRNLKEKFLNEKNKYIKDSAEFFSLRAKQIASFIREVDSAEAIYKNHLTAKTDISTAIAVSERVFNYSKNDSSKNFLLINSDGLDSQGRSIKKFNANAEVILINASGLTHTSLDSIVTIRLESVEQAIDYSLKN